MNAVYSIFPRPSFPEGDFGTALVIERDASDAASLENRLDNIGYRVHVVNDGDSGIEWFKNNSVDMIYVAAGCLDDDPGLLCRIRTCLNDNSYVPVVVTCHHDQNRHLSRYYEMGADECLDKSIPDTVFTRRMELLRRLREMHSLYRLSVQEQEIGKKIHTAAISTRILDIHPIKSINRSAAVFSGDLILLARKPGGNIHVMLADFTGHGLSAAIGALPVADTFCVMTEKGFKPEVIIRQINRKLYTLLPTSMFMSMALIQITPELDKVNIWNAGMPNIYQLGADDGQIRRSIASTSLPLGVLEYIDDLEKPVQVDINRGDMFILHSDGLTETINATGAMFGINRLESILNDCGEANCAFDEIIREFDRFQGMQELGDDVSVVAVPCVSELFVIEDDSRDMTRHVSHNHNGNWKWTMELSGASMHDVNPVPMIVHEYSALLNQPVEMMDFQNVLSELYKNALEHGVFRDARKAIEREHRVHRNAETNANLLDGCYIRVEVEMIRHEGRPALLLRLEDSGRGFDHQAIMQQITGEGHDVAAGYGLSLASSVCEQLQFNDSGNCVEAILAGAAE